MVVVVVAGCAGVVGRLSDYFVRFSPRMRRQLTTSTAGPTGGRANAAVERIDQGNLLTDREAVHGTEWTNDTAVHGHSTR